MRRHRLHIPVAILAAAFIMLTASGCKKIRPLTDLWPFGTEEEEEVTTRRNTGRRASLIELAFPGGRMMSPSRSARYRRPAMSRPSPTMSGTPG